MVEAWQLLDRPFDVLRPQVLAVDDDHVLRTADDEQVIVGHVSHVARVQPAIDQAVVGGFLVAEIGMHHALAAAPDLADLVIAADLVVLPADFDFHARDRLAAVHDGAIPCGLGQVARAPRQALFLDQFDPDAFARGHDGNGKRRLGQAIAGIETARLKACIGKGVDEVLHHVGADHVGPVACNPPARKVEPILDMRLARNASCADVVTECRRIAQRGALVAADQIEPSKRAARKMFGLEIIDRNLVGDQRQETAHQAHVVIPRQPADHAVVRADFHRFRMAAQIVQQRFVGYRNACGKAGRSG